MKLRSLDDCRVFGEGIAYNGQRRLKQYETFSDDDIDRRVASD